MHDSKLIALLQKLSIKQHKSIENLAVSTYFTKNDKDLLPFISKVITYAPLFNSPDLEKKKFYKKVFPKKKYNEKHIGYLLSDALWLCEQYLIWQHLEEDKHRQQAYLLQSYNELGLEKHYNKVLSDTKKIQQNKVLRDADFYYQEFILESISNAHFDKQRQHKFDASIQNAVDYLDLYYLATKLKFSCELLNRKNVVQGNYEIRLLNEILLYVEDKDFGHAPAIEIYYCILKTLTQPNEEKYFYDLKNLLQLHTEKISQKEARDMYAYAQNYCIKQVNNGNLKFLNDLFQLYKMTLESGVIFSGKYLSPWSYKNITGVAIRLKEYSWAENFITVFKDKIEPEFRKNAFAYNMAALFFDKGNYLKALEILRDVEFTDLFYSLDSKAMMLRVYYELEETSPLYSLLDSFRTYLQRNKHISDYQKTIYLNLIKFTKEAIKINKNEKNKAYLLKEKIEQTKQVAYLKWITEKVDALIK